jgi:hypothetical protein
LKKCVKGARDYLGGDSFVLISVVLSTTKGKRAIIMDFEQFIMLLNIIAWPVVALVAVFILRSQLPSFISGAKVTLNFGVLSIDTKLPELQEALKDYTGRRLEPEKEKCLSEIAEKGLKSPPKGWKKSGEEDKEKYENVLRTLRNRGFIQTIPIDETLNKSNSIEVSKLGYLYLKALKNFKESI